MDFLQPNTWAEALAARAARPGAVPICGGTDVMVELNFDHRRPDALLDLTRVARLRDWATQPQYVYQHQWQPGDLLIWDNTGTMHRVLEYAVDSGRLMHRTILAGEEPLQ